MVVFLVDRRAVLVTQTQIQSQVRPYMIVVLDEEVVNPVPVVSHGRAGLGVRGRQAQQEVSKWIARPGVGEVESAAQRGNIENGGLNVGSIAAQPDVMRASLHGDDAAR